MYFNTRLLKSRFNKEVLTNRFEDDEVFMTLYVTTLEQIKVTRNTFWFTQYKSWLKKLKAKWIKT